MSKMKKKEEPVEKHLFALGKVAMQPYNKVDER